MKKFLIGIISLMMTLSLTSCVATVSAQDDLYSSREVISSYDNAEIELVITYGTPYIIDGLVQYYLYNGLYYYPFYYRDYFYWRIYNSPLNVYPRYWRPMPRAYWFKSGKFYRPNRFDRHHHRNIINHNRHHDRIGINRPNVKHRPHSDVNKQRPSSTRSTAPRQIPRIQNRNGNFGGGRFTPSRPNGGIRNSAPSRGSSQNRGGVGHFGGRR